MTEILPFLYLGGVEDAFSDKFFRSSAVTWVLNMAMEQPETPLAKIYKHIPTNDSYDEKIDAWFSEAIEFIDSAKASGEKILVHCAVGISRSVSIVLAYLIKRHGLSLTRALEFVRKKRPQIDPNFSFLCQLFDFEQRERHQRARNN